MKHKLELYSVKYFLKKLQPLFVDKVQLSFACRANTKKEFTFYCNSLGFPGNNFINPRRMKS